VPRRGGATPESARSWSAARPRRERGADAPGLLATVPGRPRRANRQKPSGIAAKETVARVHLLPLLGARRLDAITTEQVQRLKHSLHDSSAKTVNNILAVLNILLKKAVEWNVIGQMPAASGSCRSPRRRPPSTTSTSTKH